MKGERNMCTAISFTNGDHYFGRNLDLEYTYNENVVISPRNYPFVFRCGKRIESHYAFIGIAHVWENYPLYYDAVNEEGLCIAALNFPGNAVYQKIYKGQYSSSFELIPWLLAQFSTVDQVKEELKNLSIVDLCVCEDLPVTSLHWLVADHKRAITIESVAEGVKVYENPVQVLTNNPPFGFHLNNLTQFLNLTNKTAENRFSSELILEPFSKGMGAIGLPGDLSSASRFVRAAFQRWNGVCEQNEKENICQFFHMLGAVEQQRGCVQIEENLYEITQYSSCCSVKKGIYYYRTYANSQISAVNMYEENLESQELICYPLNTEQQIIWQNRKRG